MRLFALLSVPFFKKYFFTVLYARTPSTEKEKSQKSDMSLRAKLPENARVKGARRESRRRYSRLFLLFRYTSSQI